MTGLPILDLIQEGWREWITTGGMTPDMDVSTAAYMAGDMIAVEDTAEYTGITVAMDTDGVIAGITVDTCMGTVPVTGEAMGMAGEVMEEAMQGIIEDIMAGDTDTEEALDGAGDIGVPIIGDHDMTATAIGIELD